MIRMRLACGFTLVEMMVTLSLLAILALAVLPLSQLSAKHQKEVELARSLRDIRDALDAWKQAVVDGHIAAGITASGYPPTLDALVEGRPDLLSPDGHVLRFIRRIPADPFAAATAEPAKSWGLRSYASPADRPAPGEDIYDVYSTSDEIGIDGRPYREW